MSTVDIFIAYSHEDLAFKNELKKFLRPMLREERISVWDDYDIEAGQEWDAAIKERLYSAGIVLLLVSADSLASDYFYGKEVQVSLERHQKGEVVVVPIILRHCDWENTPLGNLEVLPEKGRPVVDWATRDQAWQDVVTRLRRVVESVAQRQEAATAMAEHQRRFNAAIQAAEQLLEHKNWSEARAAFLSASRLYQAGFAPDSASIQQRIDACEQALQQEAAALALAQQRDAQYRRALADAEQHLNRRAFDKAEAAAQLARTLRPGDKAADQLLGAIQAAWQEAAAAQALPAASGSGVPRWVYPLGGLFLLVLVLAVWRPWKSAPRENNPPASTTLTPLIRETTPKTQTSEGEAARAFAAAKQAGTIPALDEFIHKYPQSNYAVEAKKMLTDLQTQYQAWMVTADLYIEDRDYAKARVILRKMWVINPGDEKVKRKLDRLR